MNRSLAILFLALLTCDTAFAQNANIPALTASSPLGVPGSTGQAVASGIPLGATEISPGGLSTFANPACDSTAAASSTFDGGGLSGLHSGFACTSPAAAPAATSTLSASALQPGSSSVATIPLGATEIGGAGTSPSITVAAPSTTGMAGANSASGAMAGF